MVHINIYLIFYMGYTLGRHPCLWCSINTEQMKHPREERAAAPLRTLNSLESDLLQFQTAGNGDLKQAKKYNVINQYFFKIPLTQVTTLLLIYIVVSNHMHNIGLSTRSSCHSRYILPTVDPARDWLP